MTRSPSEVSSAGEAETSIAAAVEAIDVALERVLDAPQGLPAYGVLVDKIMTMVEAGTAEFTRPHAKAIVAGVMALRLRRAAAARIYRAGIFSEQD